MWPFRKKSRTFVDSVVMLGTDSTWTPVVFGADSEEAAIVASSYGASALVTNARAAATLGARVQRRDGARWVDDSSSKLDEWVAAPASGAGEQWDWGDLIEWSMLSRYLRGRCLHRIITVGANDERLIGLQPLDSALIVGDRHPSGELKRWLLTGGGELAPHAVLHCRATSPSLGSDGAVALWASTTKGREVARVIDLRLASHANNRAAPGMVVQYEGGLSTVVGPSGKSQRDEAIESIREQYQHATKDGVPMLISGKTAVTSPPEFKVDAYGQLRRWTGEDLARVFGTPQQATKEAIQAWWWLHIEPELSAIYRRINRQVVQRFFGPQWRVWYDPRQTWAAQAAIASQVEIAEGLVRGLGYPANAAAEYVGLGLDRYEALDIANVMFTIAGREDSVANAPKTR